MKNLKINRFLIIFFLLSVVLILVFWKFFYSKKQPTVPVPPTPITLPTLTATPTTTFIPLPSVPEKGQSLEDLHKETLKEYPLFDLVPYVSEKFVVGYIEPLHLRVTLRKEDTPQIRQEVLDWIRSKGIDPATHKIEWIKKD